LREEFDNLDPSSPEVPVIKIYVLSRKSRLSLCGHLNRSSLIMKLIFKSVSGELMFDFSAE